MSSSETESGSSEVCEDCGLIPQVCEAPGYEPGTIDLIYNRYLFSVAGTMVQRLRPEQGAPVSSTSDTGGATGVLRAPG